MPRGHGVPGGGGGGGVSGTIMSGALAAIKQEVGCPDLAMMSHPQTHLSGCSDPLFVDSTTFGGGNLGGQASTTRLTPPASGPADLYSLQELQNGTRRARAS